MTIKESFLIKDPMDILRADIIDFNRLNGYWNSPKEAVETIFSWFDHLAVVSFVEIDDYEEFPAHVRDDFPNWKHVGNHIQVAQAYWNWFYNNEMGKLHLSDAPDFYGILNDGHLFWGDIGKVSASAFAEVQKSMGDHDIWITLHGLGKQQTIIETQTSIIELLGNQFDVSLSQAKSKRAKNETL